jgi:hypothetical protein
MIANQQPVRIALKTLHDNLIREGSELDLVKADLALLMAVADHLSCAIDYDGLCEAITDDDSDAIASLRTALLRGISAARTAAGKTGEFDSPW